jgi:hypothetical protein
MKTTLLLCVLAGHALAAQPVLVRITPEALAKLQQRESMIPLVKPAEGSVKVARPKEQSIIKQSTILHDGNHWTLVPNGAVVYVPVAMKSRVNAKIIGTLLPWRDFLARNPSWITTSEVSLGQAAGKESLPAERVAFWEKRDKVVIAVYQNGPISVRATETSTPITKS